MKFCLRQKHWVAIIIILISVCAGCKKNLDRQSIYNIPGPHILQKVSKRINESTGGFYAGIPADYSFSTTRYPLLLFIHGLGQMGNGEDDLDLLGADGIGKLLADKSFPVNIIVNQKTFSLLVISPQFNRQATSGEILNFLDHIKTYYRIDPKRIYLAGLSSGSQLATDVAGENPYRFAAVISMAGVSRNTNMVSYCENMVAANLPVWVFHIEDDPMVSSNTAKKFVATYNALIPPIPARLTLFPGFGHDAWSDALNPGYKENGKNIYEWMLQFHR